MRDAPYWSSFGYEWSRWPRVQLDGPGRDESERTFRAKTGLAPEEVRGKHVLEVGCGAGRFLEVVSRWGAKWLVGIDPSDAWKIASRNLKDRPNTHVLNTSIQEYSSWAFGLAYRLQAFDLVYCLGVLHHTPSAKASFLACSRLVKPGGLLCVWVYSRDMGSWTRITDLYRWLTVHMPWPLLHALCSLAGPWHYVRRIPWLGPYLWHLFPCSTHPDWRWRAPDTFDWYSPRYQSRHSEAEVRGWFAAAGFVQIESLGFPVSVRGRRPCVG